MPSPNLLKVFISYSHQDSKYKYLERLLPWVAQRAALSAKGASQARSMLALFPGKGSERALPSASRRVKKDAFKPDS